MKTYLLIFSIFLLLLTSCKPTEKGYKAAYDAALGKRESVNTDIDVNLPEGAIQDFDGAQLKEINGVKVYVLNQRIKPVEEGMRLPGSYNVAVGTYKMITNCNSQCKALESEGYNSFAVRGADDMYFTIAGSFESIDEAIKFYREYKSVKDRVYVGLPHSPIIIYSPK